MRSRSVLKRLVNMSCKVCKSDNTKHIHVEISVVNGLGYNYSICGDCKSIFQIESDSENFSDVEAGEMLNIQAIKEIDLWRRSRERCSQDELDKILGCVDVTSIKSWLDVGTADGLMVQLLNEKGVNATGIEPSEKYFQYSQMKKLPINKMFLSEVIGEFTVISLFDVLEHIEDFSSALQEIDDRLETGGYLVLRVPNSSYARLKLSMYKLLGLGGKVILMPPIHVFYFSKRSLFQVFSDRGYDLIKTYPSVSERSHGAFGLLKYTIHKLLCAPVLRYFSIDQSYIFKKCGK